MKEPEHTITRLPTTTITTTTFISKKQITVYISNRLIQRQLDKKKTMATTNSIKLLTGNSHPELAKKVAERYMHLLLLSSSQLTKYLA